MHYLRLLLTEGGGRTATNKVHKCGTLGGTEIRRGEIVWYHRKGQKMCPSIKPQIRGRIGNDLAHPWTIALTVSCGRPWPLR
jgi:hypothetical protein